MVWAKRLLAVALAAGLIVGAVVIRNELIDGDDSPDSPDVATTLVCITELRAVCEAVADRTTGLTTRIEPAATTTAAWTGADATPNEMWLTVAPLPDLVGDNRSRNGDASLDIAAETVASTDIVVAAPNTKATTLAATCGEPTLDWRCIGDATGSPWDQFGGPAGSTVRPAFASTESAVGQLTIAQAVAGFFGNAPVDAGDPAFITWVRRLARAVSPSALSGGTPIGTVQVRDSALDVAAGLDAEIADARRDRLTVLYAAPMTSVDLVVATPAGVSAPNAIVDDLADTAAAAGWTGGSSSATSLTAAQVAQATSIWEDLT